jgi:hypothetical protein
MRASRLCVLLALAGTIELGCSDAASRAVGPASHGGAAAVDEYVNTPVGRLRAACVHEVPTGARVDKQGVVTRLDGSRDIISFCAPPQSSTRSTTPLEGVGRVRSLSPTSDGWAEAELANASGGGWFSREGSNWDVPETPVGTYGSSDVYFSFPGVQSASFILQPVLSYGYASTYGGQFWALASWRCNNGSDCTHSTAIDASAGDYLLGIVQSASCSGGNCEWTVTTEDVTTATTTTLTVSDTDAYSLAVGGAIETYGLTACNQYPANGAFYLSSFQDQNGHAVSPSWSATYFSSSPSCSFDATSSVQLDTGLLGITYYQNTINLYNTAGAVTLAGGGSLNICITLSNCTTGMGSIAPGPNYNEFSSTTVTSTIKLIGAAVSGAGLTATCTGSGCLAAIKSMTASGSTITLTDAAGHTGTMTLVGATASGGLTASCPSPPGSCITALEQIGFSGDSVIITDAAAHKGYMVVQ